MNIVLGTRGSSLALAQAELARAALLQAPGIEEVRLEVIRTTGDRRLDLRLSDSGKKFEKGIFTKELEESLLSGRIDVAVHSLKDLPTELPKELMIAAVLPREDPADVLISHRTTSLAEVRAAGVIATSSPRRARQLQLLRPDLQIVDLRGNVPTRLQKLIDHPDWDGVVLAQAGLSRLGLKISKTHLHFAGCELYLSRLETMLPAAGQGAIALEIPVRSLRIHQLLQTVNDGTTWFCVQAEREFLRLLGGGCEVPIGVRARPSRLDTPEAAETGGSVERVGSASGNPTGVQAMLEAIVFEENDLVRTGSVTDFFASPELAAETLYKEIYAKRR
jgi:hydroxymethylbilane synthase